jgi:flagellar basal body-associated protein FliL
MKKPQPKKRRLLTTKILVVIGVAIVCAVSIFIYARNQQLLREDETSFRAMQAEVDAVRDEVSQKTGLTSKKVAYCSHRSEKYKDGP